MIGISLLEMFNQILAGALDPHFVQFIFFFG
jgi:hypothetical protein